MKVTVETVRDKEYEGHRGIQRMISMFPEHREPQHCYFNTANTAGVEEQNQQIINEVAPTIEALIVDAAERDLGADPFLHACLQAREEFVQIVAANGEGLWGTEAWNTAEWAYCAIREATKALGLGAWVRDALCERIWNPDVVTDLIATAADRDARVSEGHRPF